MFFFAVVANGYFFEANAASPGQNSPSNEHSITNFGAVSGGGDDLSAFTAAFGAAQAGDRVTVPPGIFQVSSSIIPKQGVALVGAGRDASVIQFIGGGPSHFLINLESGANNIEIAGLTLDGLNLAAAGQGIQGHATSGHYIHDIRIRNIPGNASDFGPHGIYFWADVTDSRVENNEFINIGTNSEWGAGIRLGTGSKNNQVIGNSIQNVGRGGILLNGATDTVIKGNTVIGSGRKGPGLGIEVFGSSHRAVVEDNVIDHWLSLDSSNFVAVRRNTVKAADGTIQFTGLELAGGSDVIFSRNSIGKGNHIGLSLSNTEPKQRVYIANNIFSESETWGAQFQDDQGGIRQIYLFQNIFRLTEKNAPNLYDTTTAGFRLLCVENGGGIRQIVFDSNQIINNDQIGIQFLRGSGTTGMDELSFVGNIISGNAGDALDIDGSFNNLEWAENTVSGNGADQILESAGFINHKPSVQIVAPQSTLPGVPVTFTVSYTDDDGISPAALLWDFEEGLPITGTTPAHVFATPGTYQVAVVTWDAEGRAAHAIHTIAVTAPPTITNGPLPIAAMEKPYEFVFYATGSPTPTFSVASGNLPPGISLSPFGVISGTPLKNGVYSGLIKAENGITPAAVQSFRVPVMATFSQWKSTRFNNQELADPEITGPMAMPQKDGVSNLQKYFHNINPAVAISARDRAALPESGYHTIEGTSYLCLTYRQNAISTAIDNLQVSSDLLSWQTVTTNISQSLGDDPTTGDPIVRIGIIGGNSARRFLRLQCLIP